jgi:hypothetical protein
MYWLRPSFRPSGAIVSIAGSMQQQGQVTLVLRSITGMMTGIVKKSGSEQSFL